MDADRTTACTFVGSDGRGRGLRRSVGRESDEWSWKSAHDSVSNYDFHATVLHLGIDHERLTDRHDGANRRLTDVHGQVVRGLSPR
jgi:hypothetical protein